MSGKYAPTDYGVRLKKAMGLAGLLDEEGKPKPGVLEKIGKELDITGAAIGMVLTGQTKQFTPVNSAKAARFLKVDHFWLATGEGEPRPPGLSEDATVWARQYDKLDVEGRRIFVAALDLAASRTGSPPLEKKQPPSRQAHARQPEEQKG